jgi:hypothetical protein
VKELAMPPIVTLNADDLIAGECPHCGAPAGRVCVGYTGKRRPGRPHKERIDAAVDQAIERDDQAAVVVMPDRLFRP